MQREGRKLRPLATAAFMSALLLSACGGSGGAGTADGGSVSGSGSVGTLLTDGPLDEFEHVNVTIEEVLLLGADGQSPVSVFQGPETVDLLALEGVADLLGVEHGVPAGDYEKIRLQISELMLVDRAADGAETTTPVRLPANGKIDLNPRPTFTVADGQTLLLELDLDAGKSIHLVQTGNGAYRFRPVIFVRTLAEDLEGGAGRLSRLHGVVESLEPDGGGFQLCDLTAPSADSTAADDDCVSVGMDVETSVFGADGLPGSIDLVGSGDELTAIGFFHPVEAEAEAEGDAADDVRLDAVVLELGGADAWSRLDGIVDTAPAGSSQFPVTVDASGDLAGGATVAAQLQSGTVLFDRDGNRLDRTDLEPGAEVELDGVLVEQEPDPDLLRTALAVVGPVQAAEDEALTGSILSVDAAAGQLTVGSGTCVAVSEQTDIVLISGTGDAAGSEAGTLEDLEPGWPVEVEGEQSLSGCFEADTVVVEVP